MEGTDIRERMESALADLGRLRDGWLPDAAALAEAPTLSGWSANPLGHPDCPSLAGRVTGHPTVGKTPLTVTSPLLWISEDRTLARTLSRFYRLEAQADATREVPVCNEKGLELMRKLAEGEANRRMHH